MQSTALSLITAEPLNKSSCTFGDVLPHSGSEWELVQEQKDEEQASGELPLGGGRRLSSTSLHSPHVIPLVLRASLLLFKLQTACVLSLGRLGLYC